MDGILNNSLVRMGGVGMLAAACCLAGLSCGGSASRPATTSQPTGTVKINGKTWTVEIAATREARYQGLSDRMGLAEGAGMLFVYPQAQELEFCMRKCLFPIDIAFLDANGVVVQTHAMQVEPYGRERYTYRSMQPAQYALEVAGGELKKAGVKAGDRAELSSIPDPAKAEPGP